MGPSGALASTWLRRNIIATVTLVVLVALASGAMSGSVAAARRSSSALDRFLEFNRPSTLQVYGESLDMEAVKALPEVVGAAERAYGLMTVEGPNGELLPSGVINPSLKRDFGPTVIPHLPPLDVAGLDSTRSLPLVFAAVVAVLGTASLVHLLLVTVRRRRREFAVLAALGANGRQLASSVASLATALAVIAVLTGVPLGLVVGRLGWAALAEGIGSPTPAIVPVSWTLAGIIVAVLVANVVGAVPAGRARRVRPAETLRTE